MSKENEQIKLYRSQEIREIYDKAEETVNEYNKLVVEDLHKAEFHHRLLSPIVEAYDLGRKEAEQKKPQTSEEIIKAIFDMLPIEPNEEFDIKGYGCQYRINESLLLEYYNTVYNDWRTSDIEFCWLIVNINLIELMQTLTESQIEEMRFLANRGFNWVAKDKDGTTEAYANMPKVYGDIFACRNCDGDKSISLDDLGVDTSHLKPMQLLNIEQYRD